MKPRWSLGLITLSLLLVIWAPGVLAGSAPSPGSVEGFVEANGVRLQYLDWGGSGPPLILIHGLADNPHVFDDLAPAFTDAFHVIAYARRGSGNSDVTGPYDVATLTQDLLGFMDALKITRADLVGYSAGGDEITELAAEHPERVKRLVYFDGAYDWSDPDFKAAINALPQGFFEPPGSATTSLGAYRSYLKTSLYPSLDNIQRVEANFRDKIVIEADGSLEFRMPQNLVAELYAAFWSNPPRKYLRVHCPALALYAETLYDLNIAEAQRRERTLAYERDYWKPFQEKSLAHLRRELANVEIVRVPGSHGSFFLTHRQRVVDSMRQFLGASTPLQSGPRFELSFPSSAHPEPITGRLFLMISRTNEPEVRLQSTWFNSPEMVAVNVTELKPAEAAVVDATALGTPLRSLDEIQTGDYYVQAVLNVYTEFHRSDGHVIWAHADHWEGQQFNKSPGNLYSKVQKLHIDRTGTYKLTLSEIIPPIQVPPDTQWLRYVRIQSKLLTQFWGQPIYLGAVVLLPRGYAEHPQTRYPVLYRPRGHFSLAGPYDFRTDNPVESESDRRERISAGYETGYEFYRSWSSEHFPRMILISLLDPTPLADWSGGVNSVNNGPYGDAIMTELIPYLEKEFRVIGEPYARVLSGRDSSGREALALQLLHPEFFGGAWIFQPWAFAFQHYFSLDIYEKANAFVVTQPDVSWWARTQSEWSPIERPLARLANGTTIATFRQLSQHDAVMAGMAGGDCLGADDAILGPVGQDGYPKRLWDRATGQIDREVANYWREHGDLAHYTQTHWRAIGPHLVGKLHFYAGEMDHFERNYGVHQFEELLKTTQAPYYAGSFEYGALKGDFQPMTHTELIGVMADHIIRNAPRNADLAWRRE